MTDQINDPTKPGYSWIEIDHHVLDLEQGIAAVVDVRPMFVGTDGNVFNTPGVGFRVKDARALAATILEHALAAELAANAAAGDAEAAARYEELRKRWDNDNLTRIYGN